MMKYLDSLGTCWPNNIIPLELIKATEDRELWKQVTADDVFDDMAPWGGGAVFSSYCGEYTYTCVRTLETWLYMCVNLTVVHVVGQGTELRDSGL